MDQTEQQYIDDLFDRIAEAERQSGPRDASAERYIRDIIGRLPNAPYYMAQALIVQDEAMKAAQQRIEDLQRELAERPAQQSGGGSFLGGLFGGAGSNPTGGTSVPSTGSVPRAGGGFSYPRDDRAPIQDSPIARYSQPERGGGGFLSGALQTATGVAGGVLLGNVLGDLFKGHGATGTAQAAEPAKTDTAQAAEPAKTDTAQPEANKAADQNQADQSQQSDQNDPFSHVEETRYDDDDSIVGDDFDDDGSYDI
jgi:hypothetical protein